jgi:hypothetical protein
MTLLTCEADEEMALLWRYILHDFQQINFLRQIKGCETANLKTARAQQNLRRQTTPKKAEPVRFAALLARENKNKVCAHGNVSTGKPGLDRFEHKLEKLRNRRPPRIALSPRTIP